MAAALLECRSGKIVEVVEFGDRDDGIRAMMRSNDQWLILVVTYRTNPTRSGQLGQVAFELATELAVGDIVDEPREALAISYC
jgi:hypothetical protein